VLPAAPPLQGGGPQPGDVEIAGGTYLLGALPQEPFVFDNEKWAHAVEVAPFRIARAAVSQGELAAFVEEGGYRRRELWSAEGWQWRQREAVEGPLYWRREGPAWLRRDFDRWVPLEPHRPVIHVSAHEAEAYCAWAGRRLPSEPEWEAAAAGAGERRRHFPWGQTPPGAEHANLDGLRLGCVDVGALAAGDTPEGCRQLLGNVWEWTASAFAPFPGFTPDPYQEYSAPWFGDHRVLRGGAWPTRARLLRNTWRNFYKPERRDVWAGFRTCAR
jgi:iron(II)-dependent oxidoreductase